MSLNILLGICSVIVVLPMLLIDGINSRREKISITISRVMMWCMYLVGGINFVVSTWSIVSFLITVTGTYSNYDMSYSFNCFISVMCYVAAKAINNSLSDVKC